MFPPSGLERLSGRLGPICALHLCSERSGVNFRLPLSTFETKHFEFLGDSSSLFDSMPPLLSDVRDGFNGGDQLLVDHRGPSSWLSDSVGASRAWRLHLCAFDKMIAQEPTGVDQWPFVDNFPPMKPVRRRPSKPHPVSSRSRISVVTRYRSRNHLLQKTVRSRSVKARHFGRSN
jgi:hypothetical protein